ncbi:MAG TPA: phospholipase D-like domain-containing protein [Vicinamibacteria bacterium]|nr:phospholipase D-like domain-containing protein [Vicinamibacteria bacterium]
MARTSPWLAALGALALGCSKAGPPEATVMTVAAEDTDTTRLARAVASAVAAHPGLAGIHALPDPRAAFAARALLAEAAPRADSHSTGRRPPRLRRPREDARSGAPGRSPSAAPDARARGAAREGAGSRLALLRPHGRRHRRPPGACPRRVLTNSLAATHVTAVHAGYAKRRVALLRSGVRLLELQRTDEAERNGVGGSSSASIHAKTFAVDRERLFVGSFNFDPRSAGLNTEMGLVIHSPALAGRLAESFDSHLPSRAYQVRLPEEGELSWIERTPEGDRRYDTVPGVGFFRRAAVGLLSILPIEREL